MSYKVNKTGDVYSLFEMESSLTIELHATEAKARELCRKANLGSGFNGWTPPFFAVKYPLTTRAEHV
jgi:hypothetical protein